MSNTYKFTHLFTTTCLVNINERLFCSMLNSSVIATQLTNSMFYGTQRFNAAFTRTLQTQFPTLIPISSWSILILSSHLCIGLPKDLFPVGFYLLKF